MDIVMTIAKAGMWTLLGLWAGVVFVAGNALLWHSFKRRKLPTFRTVQMGCPMCNEQGQVVTVYNDATVLGPCPLCDGESSLIERIEQ